MASGGVRLQDWASKGADNDVDEKQVARENAYGGRTIRHALEEQGIFLGELEESLEVLRDHLSAVLLKPEEKPSQNGDGGSDNSTSGNSWLQEQITDNNLTIARLIRILDRLNSQVDL